MLAALLALQILAEPDAATQWEQQARAQLQASPTSARLAYELAKALLALPRSTARSEESMYYLVRAAWIEGDDPLSPAERDKLRSFVKRSYDGPDGGFGDWVASATTPKLDRTQFRFSVPRFIFEHRGDNGYQALWKHLRFLLTQSTGGAAYWQQIRGAPLPRFRGRVVSSSARELFVAIEGNETPEILLRVDGPTKAATGSTIQFDGAIPTELRQAPFLLVAEQPAAKVTVLSIK